MSEAQQIVSRMWNYCHLLRDEGLSYLEYIEQLTYLLFLKMAHEKTLPPYNRPSAVPAGCDWPSLLARDGTSWRPTIGTSWRASAGAVARLA